jgi:hypothetical protein
MFFGEKKDTYQQNKEQTRQIKKDITKDQRHLERDKNQLIQKEKEIQNEIKKCLKRGMIIS